MEYDINDHIHKQYFHAFSLGGNFNGEGRRWVYDHVAQDYITAANDIFEIILVPKTRKNS